MTRDLIRAGQLLKIEVLDHERFRKVCSGTWEVRFTQAESRTVATSVTQADCAPSPSPLATALVERGVGAKAAEETVRKYPAEEIRTQVEALDWLVARKDSRVSRNPPGFLLSAIQGGYATPPGFIGSAEKARREQQHRARRDLTAKQQTRREERERIHEQKQERAVAQFLERLPSEERLQLEHEAVRSAPPLQRSLIEPGGSLAEAARKLAIDTPVPGDPAKWHTVSGVLSITGAQFINWNQGVGGGGAIDLVMHVQQLGFGQTLQWLEHHFGPGPSCPLAFTPAPPPRALTLPPPAAHHWPHVEHYLIEQRRLPPSLLRPLVHAGIIYADARANAVFLLGDTPATAVGAELRGTTSPSWRGMAPGSRKDHGCFSVPTASADAIVLCESAIDALSCHLLHRTFRCLSTSGARPNPAWLSALLPLGLPIFCGFDADPTGDAMAHRLIQLHPSVRRLHPRCCRWGLQPQRLWWSDWRSR